MFLTQLDTLQKDFALKIQSQKYDTAICLTNDIDLLINQFLAVEKYKDKFITKEYIGGNLIYIFEDN